MLQEREAQGFVSHGIPMDPTGELPEGFQRGDSEPSSRHVFETIILVTPESFSN